MAAQHADDGFHEIQLNGKQLVFLFMAATVVSVVIFLCGVLVGRGVRAERVSTTAEPSSLTPLPADAPAAAAPAVASAGSDPTRAAPPPTVDDLSYFNRLEKPGAPVEDLKAGKSPSAAVPAAGAPATAAPATAAPAAPPAAPPALAPAPASPAAERAAPAKAAAAPPKRTPATTAADAGDLAEPKGNGYAVQVAALNVRGEADAIARRLSAKGYSAYVVAPAHGTSMFRVRVGKFTSRREAESVAGRLQKEEEFKPWITR